MATSVETDPPVSHVTATSVAYQGTNDSISNTLAYYQQQGACAVMEAMGASPWDAGHYMQSTDTEPGHKLIVIAQDSGWLDNYSAI